MVSTQGRTNLPCKITSKSGFNGRNGGINMKKVELGICHVNLLADFLKMLKKDDCKILKENGYKTEVEEGYAEKWIEDLLNNFCEPLIEYDKDTEIILEE